MRHLVSLLCVIMCLNVSVFLISPRTKRHNFKRNIEKACFPMKDRKQTFQVLLSCKLRVYAIALPIRNVAARATIAYNSG